jgi:hypothetical protein
MQKVAIWGKLGRIFERKKMKVGDIVKWAEPIERGEEGARYVLIEHNGDRGFIRLICDMSIPPVQLVRTSDIVVAEDTSLPASVPKYEE